MEEERRSYEDGRISMMRSYAETIECRRGFILNYFGEETAGVRCGLCDNDVMAEGLLDASHEMPGQSYLSTGDMVIHERWGEGVVRRVATAGVTVAFETAGYKTLDPEVVLDSGILRKKDETS